MTFGLLTIISLFIAQSLAQRTPCQFSFPRGCTGSDCHYDISWETHGENVLFKINAKKQSGYWTGVGFSVDKFMANTDVIVGWATGQNQGIVSDRWATSQREPRLDRQSNILSQSASFIDGITSITFSRKIATPDLSEDTQLNICPYFFFPVDGGTTAGNTINYHSSTPRVYGPICSLKCDVPSYIVERGYCPRKTPNDIRSYAKTAVEECVEECNLMSSCKAIQYNASDSSCVLRDSTCTVSIGQPGTIYKDTFTYTRSFVKTTTTQPTRRATGMAMPKLVSFEGRNFNCPGNLLKQCQDFEPCGGSLEICAKACREEPACRSFAYDTGSKSCFLKKIGLCAESVRKYNNDIVLFYVKGLVTTTTTPKPTSPVVTSKPEGPAIEGYVQFSYNCPGNIIRTCLDLNCQPESSCAMTCTRNRLCQSFAYNSLGKECFHKSIPGCEEAVRKYNNPAVRFYVKENLIKTTTTKAGTTTSFKSTTPKPSDTESTVTSKKPTGKTKTFLKLDYNCPGNSLGTDCTDCTSIDICKTRCGTIEQCKGFSFKLDTNDCLLKSIADCDPTVRVTGNNLVEFYSRQDATDTTTTAGRTTRKTTSGTVTKSSAKTTPVRTTTIYGPTTTQCNVGPRGERGPQGVVGPKGDQGPQGPIGVSNGAPGPPGSQGSQGEKGSRGSQGYPGQRGNRGQQGPVGPKGDLGPIGLTGSDGVRGYRGENGQLGKTGPIGIKGETGSKGDKGLPGRIEGGRGVKGDKGTAGITGEKGAKGQKGASMKLTYNSCPTSRCGANSTCVNLYNDYVCKCKKGFKRKDKHICEDINECDDGYCEQLCDNFVGGYVCRCFGGYRLGNNSRSCLEIDECQEDSSRCGSNEQCVNTVGSYSCIPNKKAVHSDLVKNRCEASPCKSDEQCVNTLNATQCLVKPQTVQNEVSTSEDMDQTFNKAVLILGLLIWLIVLTIIIIIIIFCMCMLKKEERKRAHYLYEHDDMAMAYDNGGLVAEPWEG